MNILIIEDNIDHSELISDLLYSAFDGKVNIALFSTLNKGLAYASRSNHVDIVLCDLSLPDSTIAETVNTLSHFELNIPFIVLTSLNDMTLAMDLIHKGIQDYLPKDELSASLLFRACHYAIERRSLLDKIEYMATHDSHTNLYNRAQLDSVLRKQISYAVRHDIELYFCLCDIDNFKFVNDQFGHISGDKAIKEFGVIVSESLRAEDNAGRFGGDEFALLLCNIDEQGALAVAERIRKNTEKLTIECTDQKFKISTSIGISKFQNDMSADDLINAADRALYRAKEQGRNKVKFSQTCES
jgi:diguanylate cyclase (GGDEF)-like protein